ncbi:YHYH protein [Rubinisphaera sp. JC750]|uniref:YHYH protein n=1 Tax=Rubinisphaera sp. JC750 TaxID=2898658 RepID=UPI001F290465|nr:YHYH protein [Rubinisphaera sp. JC750]
MKLSAVRLAAKAVFLSAGMIATISAANAQWENQVEITVRGEYRYIQGNGIPNHETGQFPNRNNPNQIRPQRHQYRVPVDPVVASQPTPMEGKPFGIAVNGVPFDPGTAETYRGDRRFHYEALTGVLNLGLDSSNAHVQPTGAYHYHGLPTELIKKEQLRGKQKMTLLGYAADGFPIYSPRSYADPNDPESGTKVLQSSYRLKQGTRTEGPPGRYDGSFAQDFEYVAGLGDLDECNGREGVTPEYPEGTYYYVLTTEFPFIPRMCKGTPDESFNRRGPGPGQQTRPGPPPGRRPPFPPGGFRSR